MSLLPGLFPAPPLLLVCPSLSQSDQLSRSLTQPLPSQLPPAGLLLTPSTSRDLDHDLPGLRDCVHHLLPQLSHTGLGPFLAHTGVPSSRLFASAASSRGRVLPTSLPWLIPSLPSSLRTFCLTPILFSTFFLLPWHLAFFSFCNLAVYWV